MRKILDTTTECDGQTGYTLHILDGIIEKVVRQIFSQMKAIPKSEIIGMQYEKKLREQKLLLQNAQKEYRKVSKELDSLKGEVVKAIRGESSFSKELLGSLIDEAEEKSRSYQAVMEKLERDYKEGQTLYQGLATQYDDVMEWSELFDHASFEAKKMIVSKLISRVEVSRDYRLKITFRIDIGQFARGMEGMEILVSVA